MLFREARVARHASRQEAVRKLEGCVFNDSLLAAVVAAFTAYGVVDVPCAAVGAKSEGGGHSLIVGAALCGAGL